MTRYRDLNGWKPMKVAPRDGTLLLAVRDNGCGWDTPRVVQWDRTYSIDYPWRTPDADENEDNAYPEDRLHYFKELGGMPYAT